MSVEDKINDLYQKASRIPKSYSVGDHIKVNNEYYYVIADSPKNQDYVVALKETPLTVAEVNNYGSSIPVSAINRGGYGGMAYHQSSSVYSTSNVKVVVDAWSSYKFTNNQLKEIDEYKAMLITVSELVNLGFERSGNKYPINDNVPEWTYGINYWTMTSYNSTVMWVIHCYKEEWSIDYYRVTWDVFTIRPVINVYKSAIQKIN